MFASTKSASEKFIAKSDKVFDVFTDTLRDLSLINSDIEDAEKEQTDVITQAQQELQVLQKTKGRNERLIGKIQEFLS